MTTLFFIYLRLFYLVKSSHSQSVYLKTEPSSATLYQKAKTVFRRTAIPSRLIGREKEREILLKFWLDHVMNNHPGCMYISGMPGTGKTAMLNEIMRMTEDDIMALRSHKVKIMVINCMSIQEPKKIYLRLVEDMKSASSLIQSDIIKQAETLINSDKHRMNVVVLDEIDSLITKEQEVLYRLFEWASLPDSRLVLIGVANALDLTDRILPRLRAKNCEPQLLNFNPYQVSEISAIIKDRLYSLREDPENMFGPAPPPEKDTPIPLVHPSAIELCARKVAASMGDLRTALDVCRQAIGLAETEREKKAVLGEKAPNGVAKSVPTVTIAHVMRVLNGVFGSPIIQKLKQLNIQQKVVLGVFVVMLRLSKGPKKDQLTMGKVK
ncbi:P-loop containing nucleoside triphosphate hydrolase protein [Pilobolus umbonatus]|nr:P-loop containing nucleoside triphosphate hydrolase protein [Pilobolus umbonatus]